MHLSNIQKYIIERSPEIRQVKICQCGTYADSKRRRFKRVKQQLHQFDPLQFINFNRGGKLKIQSCLTSLSISDKIMKINLERQLMIHIQYKSNCSVDQL